MRKGGGKQKGASFERQICKDLSLWISKGRHEDIFWRSAMSGGRSTVAAKRGKKFASQAGDLSSVQAGGNAFIASFLVECKFYRDLRLAGLLTKTGKLAEFWETVRRQGRVYQKLPMLIAKQNQLPVMVCLTTAGLDMLGLRHHRALWAVRIDMHVVLLEDYLVHAKFGE